jgi:hypothetical protein
VCSSDESEMKEVLHELPKYEVLELWSQLTFLSTGGIVLVSPSAVADI